MTGSHEKVDCLLNDKALLVYSAGLFNLSETAHTLVHNQGLRPIRHESNELSNDDAKIILLHQGT